MLTLNDGRSELWQWDTGRKLTVDADCTQVHFSNKVFGRSIDVDVMDGVAIIPDILLQTDKELTAWAFVGISENGYTKISKSFKVNRRNKPADYVFTQTEQTTLSEILERIDDLEAMQDPDAIKNAVEDYLEQNPVEAPVKSVNGKSGEVELTAEDVGAISQDDLQEATNEALAQAKASGEFDGQPGRDGVDGKDGYTPVKYLDYFTPADVQEIAEQAAGMVDVPSGGGGGDVGYETLVDIVLEEDTASLTITTDKNGKPFSLMGYFIYVYFPTASPDVSGIYFRHYVYDAASKFAAHTMAGPAANSSKYEAWMSLELADDFSLVLANAFNRVNIYTPASFCPAYGEAPTKNAAKLTGPITKIVFMGGVHFPAGTVLKIFKTR